MIMKRNRILLGLLFISMIGMTSCNHDNKYDATGTFEASEITVSAEISGTILNFDITEGSEVDEGQAIGLIDSTQLTFQREQLKFQQQALLANRPNEKKQVASLKEQILKQEREMERLKKLQKSDAATSKQVDDVETQLSILRSQLEATLQTLSSGNTAATNNAAAMEMQIQSISHMIRKCTITSPVKGTVLVKYAEAGEMAVQGKPLFKVADLEHMYLRAYLTCDQLADVKLGQEVKVIADFGGDKQIEYPGTITWISQESEFTPKGIQTQDSRANMVYAVKIAVPNDGKLKIGLYGEVKF